MTVCIAIEQYANAHLTSLQYTKALQLIYYISVIKLAQLHLKVWLDAPAFAQVVAVYIRSVNHQHHMLTRA
jgi:hypothetical protein